MTPATPDEAAEWHRVAEERRRQLERLQDQALYRTAAAVLGRGRRAAHGLRRVGEPIRDLTVRLARSVAAAPVRLRAPAREAALRSRLAALPAPSGGPSRRSDVTAVIVTAIQPQRLDVLLAALGRLGVDTLVVDNAGVAENALVVARHPHARRLALPTPINYAQANEHAIAEVRTTWTLLLNDDVAPIDEHWLDRMLAAADDGTVAVGAQLVHGRRGPLGGAGVDGLVQHAGIGLLLDGPLVRTVHLGRGSVPAPSGDVRTVPAATAACLLVRTATHRTVGGFHGGFDYGSEDVDLCLRLAAHGEVRVAMGAVLLHEEGATRLLAARGGDRHARARRQAANRALLDARHAPDLRRQVVRAAFAADASRAGTARVAIGVAGPAPDLLVEALALRPACRVAPRGSGALTVVTDPTKLADAGSGGDVPLVGWVDRSRPVRAWDADVLERLDALFVLDAANDEALGATFTAEHPTLPVIRVGDAVQLGEALRDLLLAPRWTIRIGTPAGRAAARWGDGPVAEALRRELRAHGLVVRSVGRDGWGRGADRAADVTLHLKGRGVAPVADAQTNVIWVMSHPSEVAPGELEAADLVIAGSDLLAERYRGRGLASVATLPQAADARRFSGRPVQAGSAPASRVLFVGNTRSVARPAVLGAVDAGLPLTLVGSGWERYLDPRRVARESVPYDELAAWYRAADVVLNDHWEDMARWGLVSNRVFDVLACGCCVVSDEVPGMDGLVDAAVVTFRDRADVGPTVQALLADPDGRRERSERGQRAVLAAHTWEHRAAELVRLVAAAATAAADGDPA
jgi:GT2 family glycosyltransferase/glycosyltransferase involved in cell wall biosynthesis